MKKETQYNLVKKYPHAFSAGILRSLNLNSAETDSKKLITDFRKTFSFDHEYFKFGEGWSPILEALTISLNEINADLSEDVESEDDMVIVKISDVQIRNKNLSVNFECEHNLTSEHLMMLDTFKKFALEMSKLLCEICGTQIVAEDNLAPRCAICKCKRL